MATTFVPKYNDPITVDVEDLRDELQDVLESNRGDEDKAGTIEDSVYYGAVADFAESFLRWMTSAPTNKEMNSMAEKKTMDNIEKVVDTASETVDTLERIPTARLNGTTKNQQYVILGTVAGAGLVAGVMITRTLGKVKAKFQQHRNKKTIENFAAGKDVS